MDGLGKMARDHDCHITSHVSESYDEVAFSLELARQDYGGIVGGDGDGDAISSSTTPPPPGDTDLTGARVFDSHGLLTDKCIMAHGVHLSDPDLDLMKMRGSAVAHCPLSNYYFAGGTLPCKHLLRRGNKVGLGTDIGGAYHPSILDSAKKAVLASLSLQHHRNRTRHEKRNRTRHEKKLLNHDEGGGVDDDADDPTLDFKASFYLATLGGAEALGMEDRIGTFRVGMEFDAIVLTSSRSSSHLPDIFPTDSLADKFQKLWILGDDRSISRVFVQGRQVK
jgi:guanine deaminase